MAIDSYNKFKDYCLRALGQDEDKVIKVEVTEAQLRDRIEDALKKWQDFHFEGSTSVSIHKYIRASDLRKGYLECDDLNAISEILTTSSDQKSNAEVMDDIDWRFHLEYADNHLWGGGSASGYGKDMALTDYHINMEYLASMRYLFTADKLFTFNATSNRLYLQGQYEAALPPQLIEEFRVGNWGQGTGTDIIIDSEELPNGNLGGTRIANNDSGVNPILASFTHETDYYPRGLRTFSIQLKTGTYSGKVKINVKDRTGTVVNTTTVQPKDYWTSFELEAHYKDGHINDYVFELESTEPASDVYFCANKPSGYRNNFIILVGYETASPDDIDVIWDSGWLKEYAIALIMRQWAQNLSKYEQIQMAGGVTLNAEAMYQRADERLDKLNEDLDLKWSMPPAMFIG